MIISECVLHKFKDRFFSMHILAARKALMKMLTEHMRACSNSFAHMLFFSPQTHLN